MTSLPSQILAYGRQHARYGNPVHAAAIKRLEEIGNDWRQLPKLLTSSVKTRKGEKIGILTGILYLAAADSAGTANVCPKATLGCKLSCLGHTSGRMVLTTSRVAQVIRTWWLFGVRPRFHAQLNHEIFLLKKRARKKGMRPYIRLNGTSDLPIGFLAPDYLVPEAWHGVVAYDYTKVASRALQYRRCPHHAPPSYHLTFSRSEVTSDHELKSLLDAGINVAVVSTLPRPDTYLGYPTIDGDETDARPTDTTGVVWLSAKGPVARRDKTGFVVQDLQR